MESHIKVIKIRKRTADKGIVVQVETERDLHHSSVHIEAEVEIEISIGKEVVNEEKEDGVTTGGKMTGVETEDITVDTEVEVERESKFQIAETLIIQLFF